MTTRFNSRVGRAVSFLTIELACAAAAWAAPAPTAGAAPDGGGTVVQSPSGQIGVRVEVRDFDDAKACPAYSVTWKGKPLIVPSRLRLGSLGTGVRIVGQQRQFHDASWKPVYGERATIRDRYHALNVQFDSAAGRFEVALRVYDEGVAFCYLVPAATAAGGPAETIVIPAERSEFRFAGDHPCWVTRSAQGEYVKTTLRRAGSQCERPMPIQAGAEAVVAVGEARLVDFARMKLASLGPEHPGLVSQLSGEVRAALPLRTPWRVVMVAENAAKLLEHNDLFLNLNDPCALKDTSWIKPGKVIREVTLTTQGGKACVDFAQRRHLQYVEFDAGWYGPENSDASDARGVHVDPARSKGPLDLAEVIRYASQRNVGILLYVNHRALERQLDEIFPLYRQWGIKGVKFGFVNVGEQRWTSWLHDAIRKAAEHQLMVDVHDEYRLTGYSRTYPNLLTAEGVRGDEASPPPSQTLTFLFSRYLGGPADNTICYFDPRVGTKIGSHASQLAKAVCLYSPWQFLYWYDRPPAAPGAAAGAGGGRPTIHDEPELEFFDRLPTVWDDTRVLRGQIGQSAVVARRRGSDWFIGWMNAERSRGAARTQDGVEEFDVPLNFLEPGQPYAMRLYTDDPAVSTRTHVKVERRRVDCNSRLKLPLLPAHGAAAWLTPSTGQE